MEYRLRCLDAQGAVVQVPVQAASLEGASQEARRRGLTMLSAQRSGGRKLPHRPDRIEPRAKKRRPKPLPLLTVPRHIAREEIRVRRGLKFAA